MHPTCKIKLETFKSSLRLNYLLILFNIHYRGFQKDNDVTRTWNQWLGFHISFWFRYRSGRISRSWTLLSAPRSFWANNKCTKLFLLAYLIYLINLLKTRRFLIIFCIVHGSDLRFDKSLLTGFLGLYSGPRILGTAWYPLKWLKLMVKFSV